MSTINALSQHHYKMLEYCLRGWTNAQIAEAVGMSSPQVSLVLSSPCFQHELAMRRGQLTELSNQEIVAADAEVTAEIRRHTLEAAKRLGAIVHDDAAKHADQIRAAEAILDRGGQPRVQRQESKGTVLMLSAADLQLLQESLALAQEGGNPNASSNNT